MMMNSMMGFLVGMLFLLACLALIAYLANHVLRKLFDTARLGMAYYDYRKFLQRCQSQPGLPPADDYWPVALPGKFSRFLDNNKANGFKVRGLVVDCDGKTFELYSEGETVHTGLYYKEGVLKSEGL